MGLTLEIVENPDPVSLTSASSAIWDPISPAPPVTSTRCTTCRTHSPGYATDPTETSSAGDRLIRLRKAHHNRSGAIRYEPRLPQMLLSPCNTHLYVLGRVMDMCKRRCHCWKAGSGAPVGGGDGHDSTGGHQLLDFDVLVGAVRLGDAARPENRAGDALLRVPGQFRGGREGFGNRLDPNRARASRTRPIKG